MNVIELIGMPRSGKSTQAELLKKTLEAAGKTAVLLADREHMARLAVPPQESLAFALAYYGSLLDSYYVYKDKADALIIDRGWNDAAVWADVYRAMKVVSEEEAAALARCFDRYARLATAVVNLQVAPQVTLERHRATLHETIDDVAINPEWLAALKDAYEKRKNQFTNPIEIDGTLPPEEAHARIMAFLEATNSF